MEASTLERSIREEAARTIASIREAQAHELEELDRAYEAEIAAYREQIEAESALLLEWELSRIKNRSILEGRKLRLRILEEVVKRSVEGAFGRIRHDHRYQDYLLRVIRHSLEQAAGSEVVIYVGEDDGIHENTIRELIEVFGAGRTCELRREATLMGGGVIVEDREMGRIFNGTLERVCFRKMPDIRREAMEVLKKHGFGD